MRRDESIDALKGLAIVFVVLGHAIPAVVAVKSGGAGLVELDPGSWVPVATAKDFVFNLAYSFHMPLFAFLSGWVLHRPERESGPRTLLKRARGLLLPYFAWFVVTFLVLEGPDGLLPALGDVALGAPRSHGLWFLYALFVSAVLLVGVKALPAPRLAVPLSAIAVAACNVLPVADRTLLGFGVVAWLYPFVALGWSGAAWRERLASRPAVKASAAALVYLGLFALLYPFQTPELSVLGQVTLDTPLLRGGHVLVLPARYVCATAGVYLLWLGYQRLGGPALRAQAWLGRRSLGIYAIHGLVLTGLIALGLRNWPLAALVSLGLSALATFALERVPVLSTLLLGSKPPAATVRVPAGAGAAGETGADLSAVQPSAVVPAEDTAEEPGVA